MASDVRVSEAITRLRSDGFQISGDKVQRWRCFGITSFRKSRANYFKPTVYRNLQYVLQIERQFGFERDHDGLALELAYRQFPVVPLDRVHDGARKELATMFSGLNRELHKIDDSGGLTFAPRRIPHAARNLVRRYLPNRKIRENPALANGRNILEKIVHLWLRVAYENEVINEAELLPILYAMGARDPAAVQVAITLAKIAVPVVPLLRPVNQGPLSALLDRPFEVDEVRYTIATMRIIYGMNAHMSAAGVSVFQSFTLDYPKIESEDTDPIRADVALRSLMYAGAVFLASIPMGKAMIDHVAAGNPYDPSVPIATLVAMKNVILPTIFGESIDA
ncbi:MAG TPA: hypothetical protein VGF98_09100 [Candidatus Tumulicola sp.]|jgi:hypothetical protein